jgi:hypothetical protein
VRRRQFIAGLGTAAAAWPIAVDAQQAGKVHRIGFLWENANTFPDALDAFRQELRRLGYTEGSNLVIEFRWAEGNPERMRELRLRQFLSRNEQRTNTSRSGAFTPLFIAGAKPLAELGLKYKVASLYGPKQHVFAGGLMSYLPDRADLWRRGAGYVDKILKGVKPADLAVQQPVKYELAINLKPANTLGIDLPPTLLARADEVIE